MPLGRVQMSMGSLLQKLRSWCHLEALSPGWCSVTSSATLNYSTTLQVLTPKDAKRCGVSPISGLSPCPDESGEPRNEASGELLLSSKVPLHSKLHNPRPCSRFCNRTASTFHLFSLRNSEIHLRWRNSEDGCGGGGGARTNYTIMSNHCFLLFFFIIGLSHLSLEHLFDQAVWDTCQTLHSPWKRFRSISWRKETTRISQSQLHVCTRTLTASCTVVPAVLSLP